MASKGFLFALCGLIGVLVIERTFIMIPFVILALFLIIRGKHKSLALVLLSVMLLFSLRAYFQDVTNHSQLTGDERLFQGDIKTIPLVDGDRLSLQLQLSSNEELQVRYRMKTKSEKEAFSDLKPGMTCRLKGELVVPDGKRNPGGFDYKTYLKNNQIHWLLDADSIEACMDSSLSLVDRLKRYRQAGIKKVETIFSPEISGVAQALLFGDRTGMNAEVIESYQTLGLIHVLVVSGLHVGIVTALCYWLLIRIGITRERAIDLLLLFLPIYVVLTGAAPSVLRAAVMAAGVLLAMRFKLKLHPLDGICGAFLLLLFYDPNMLFDVGFQLSFLISFALIVSANTVNALFHYDTSRLLAVAVVSQLIALPLLLVYFYQFSPWSLLVNVLFVPLFSIVILPLSFLVFLLALFFPFISYPFVVLYEIMISVVHWTLHIIESFPFASIVMGQPSGVYVILYYIAIFYAFTQIEIQKWRKAFLPVAVLVLIQLLIPYVNPYGKVTMIDVGQGDSILVELPFRKAIYLVDTGGSVHFGQEEDWQKRGDEFDVGREIVLPVLKAKGIRQIDKLILTHGDEDHIGGAHALFSEVKIRELLYGKNNDFDENEIGLLEAAHETGINVLFVEKGMRWQEAGISFHVLAPVGNEHEKNEQSIVFLAEFGGLSWLFTGDIEGKGEMGLRRNYPELNVDVLKVAHHGSKTSTSEELLDQLEPKVALISAGKNNIYNHPNQEVIERLKKRGISVLRTDRLGAISYYFTKNSGKFKVMEN